MRTSLVDLSANSTADGASSANNATTGNAWGHVWDHEVNPFGDQDAAELTFTEQENSQINFDAYEDIPVETTSENEFPAGTGSSGHTGGWGNGGRWDYSEDHEVNPFCDQDDTEPSFTEQENTRINFDPYEDVPVKITGKNVPPHVNSFAEIDLGEGLNQNITRCNYMRPTLVQRHAIPISLAGRDLMACAQTGSGKTAAFCFPIISGIMRGQPMQRPPCEEQTGYPLALVLSPTRELSMQIHKEAKRFSYQTGVRVVAVYGGASINKQIYDLKSGVDILVATPGRLVDLWERARVSLLMIRYLVFDEADKMLGMGFEPQIRKIVQHMDMPPKGVRQTMLFSATFPSKIKRLASDFLKNYIFLAVGRVGSITNLIDQKVEYVQESDKRSHLMDLLQAQSSNGVQGMQALTLVFVERKQSAVMLENWLREKGFPVTAFHGDMTQKRREHALKSFKSGETPILVATSVAARGLDIPHIAHVVNFDFPRNIDDYVHRIGRTGRTGKKGLATAFFNDSNAKIARALQDRMQQANQEVPAWLSQYADQCPDRGRNHQSIEEGRVGNHDFRREGSDYHSTGNNCGGYGASGGDAGGYDVPENNQGI